jgi:hypothetical protein
MIDLHFGSFSFTFLISSNNALILVLDFIARPGSALKEPMSIARFVGLTMYGLIASSFY